MSISISDRKITSFALLAGLIGSIHLLDTIPAHAYSVTFSNGNFESSTTLDGSNGWNGTGSTDINGTYSGVNPFDTQQGIITTGCPAGSFTECLNRNDDPGTSIGTFNLNNQDQISASPEIATLQTQLGLNANDFSIIREIDGTQIFDTNGNPLYRTPKEGSAIFQDITISGNGTGEMTDISFNWDFLTNDGGGSLGDKDFGFFAISNPTDSSFEPIVVKLEDSTGAIPTASGSNYQTSSNPYAAFLNSYNLSNGTYRISFGVVDVDGVGNSSALLIDDFEAVPFEFSPTAGIALVFGFIGWNKFRRRFSK